MSLQLDELLTALLQRRGSDLHLKAGRPPLFRISGKIVPTEFAEVSASEIDEVLGGVMAQGLRDRLVRERSVDFSYAHGDKARFRVNAFYQRGQLSVVMRAVPVRVPGLTQLCLPGVLRDIAMANSGLVLVTGPTGSGKSTTLAAMVEHINERRQAHVITIEDPIEFIHEDRNSVINQREIGYDSPDFAAALRHVLRQDPDVILIGEMRDAETIATAMTAAETGHLVLSTLHTIDAPQTVDRIIDAFPAEQQLQVRMQLASVLRAVISQRLVPMASGSGMVAAVEVMVSSPQVQTHIAEGDVPRLHRVIEESAGGLYRMQTLNQSLATLVHKGMITLDTARAGSPDPDELGRFLRQLEAA